MENRKTGIDIIKVLASISVVGVHFFLYTQYYETPLTNTVMIIQSILRNFFMICIPLFVLVTGYLMGTKKIEIEKKHYKKVIPILITVFFISFIVVILRRYYFKDPGSLLSRLASIVSFNAAVNFYWYIEMYLGLFLIIPFINILYQNINKKNKQYLIIILLILTHNSFLTAGIPFRNKLLVVLGDYWFDFYPITFYFIGAYIAEFKPKIKKSILLLAGLLVMAITNLLHIFISYSLETKLPVNSVVKHNSLLIAVISVIVFLLLYDLIIKNKKIEKIVVKLSNLTLEIYLFSYIIERLVYPYFIENYFVNQSKFTIYILLTTPIIYILSVIASLLKEFIFKIGTQIFNKLLKNK